ncbi:MAG TPA: ATP-dependent DNA helicase, partial [Thermoplasmata archaeon]|nr:ATP-dependent DNA helicase [Thermoplasmata archaeon]
LASSELSSRLLNMAHREAEEFGDPAPGEGVTATRIMVALGRILTQLADSYLFEERDAEDALVPGDELKVELMHALVAPSTRIDGIVKGLEAIGDGIRSQRAKEGRLPRSYIGSVATFLNFWLSLEEERYARLICDREDPRLQGYCLDPSTVTGVLADVHSSVHISGTLSPLEQYRDGVGLAAERTTLLSLPSPFPPENRLLLYDDRVTTRYEELNADETALTRLHSSVAALCNGVRRAKAVFFPSHALLGGFQKSPEFRELRDEAFVESAEMTQSDLMMMVKEFKLKRSLLLAVMGGRVAEGLDFPDDELEMVVLAGIPYPRPTARLAALERYCERRFGRGWEYAVRGPTVRRMLQTMGRLIRTERDRGVVVVLDKRAKQFSTFVPGLRLSRDPLGESLLFYAGQSPIAEIGRPNALGPAVSDAHGSDAGFESAASLLQREGKRE